MRCKADMEGASFGQSLGVGAVERTPRALLQSNGKCRAFLTGRVTFVHVFCTHGPCFRTKSPHRSHIDRDADPRGSNGPLRSAAMSDHAFDFLQSWIVENVNARTYEDKDTAQHLVEDCIWEARTRGITKADLIEAAGGDLDAYMLAELNRTVDPEVEDRIAQAVS